MGRAIRHFWALLGITGHFWVVPSVQSADVCDLANQRQVS